MTERSGYAAGTPSWVDLASPDLEASKRFYGGLFGWQADASGDPEQTGGYTMFTLNAKLVAGLGPLQGEGLPPAWTTYVSVDDADATAAKAKAAGATVMMEPFDVLDAGRMAVFVDPTGAFFSIWQPGAHKGAELVNEPNTLCWNELTTRDIDTARDFYRGVFGWGCETNPFEGTVYTEWKLGGKSIGGMIQMTDDWPAEIPSHWMTYFAVDDTDAIAKRTEELGGGVPVPPTDIPPGRFAVLDDPHGAVFSVIEMADE
jgi:predicted enzyme related to lactoylglutathione lyase